MTADTSPEDITAGLNDQQCAAVTSTHPGPILVLAGAGCGKTTVLARRVSFCARNHCDQKRILALTFTRKASVEMLERVMRAPGIDPERPMPTITTFHAFGLRILRSRLFGRRNFDRLGYRGDSKLISEGERLRMLAAVTTWVQRQRLGVDLAHLDVLLAQKAVHPRKLDRLPEDKRALLADIESAMAAAKKRAGLWDFADIIGDAMRLFEEYPETRSFYERHFGAILVDEFQDTNPLQIAFLLNLGARTNRLFAVGDDDQAIYGFRGADITPIMTFDSMFPGAAIYKLEINYRSTPAVLRCANRVFASKAAAFRKVLVSGRYGDRDEAGRPWPKPEVRRFRTQAQTAGWIWGRAQALERSHQIPVTEMAVLFRVNQTLEWTRAFLSAHGLDSDKQPHLLTVHGSKGLEFPVVFVCDLEEEVFPSYRRTSRIRWRNAAEFARCFFLGRQPLPDDCDLDEEKRLFYVAVTRAERHLFLLYTRTKEHHGRQRSFQKSRFLRIV